MFTREDTKAIKGIAVIMMLLHHLAGFPERYAQGFEGFRSLWKPFVEDGYLGVLAMNAKLCVSIFFFIGGYGLYKRWSAQRFSVTQAILNLYRSYWKVFLVFIPIAFLFFSSADESLPYLCTKYYFEDKNALVSTVLSNFLGLSDSLNGEWWFFIAYLCVLPLGVLFCEATRKHKSFALDMFLVLMIDILVRDVFVDIQNTPAFGSLAYNYYYTHFLRITTASPFFAGIALAKYNKLEQCKAYLQRYRFSGVLGLVGCLGVLYVRSFILGEAVEIVHAIAFTVFASVFTDSLKPLKKTVCFIGAYSTDMWLIHSFFCYYFFSMTKIVYATSSVWVDLLILILLSLAASILLECFWKLAGRLSQKLSKRLIRPEAQAQ